MRLVFGIWLSILVFGLFIIDSTVAPNYAIASNSCANEAIPIATNTTLFNEETTQSKIAFQASSLSLSLRTDKPVYLTGETIAITVSTSASNTYVRVTAQLPSGYQERIAEFTTSGTYTYSWSAPPTPGQVRLMCQGEATIMVMSTCYKMVCVDKDCWYETYPCLQPQRVTGNASYDIRIFSRVTSLSGQVIDTNQQPVPGASVYLSSTNQSTTTNSDGSYEFRSYELSNNYNLVNQIPTVTETVSVKAVACELQPGKILQVQAERGASGINFTLNRCFYPANIDLSEFTFNSFPGWKEAEQYSTWQNILGVTVDEPPQLRKLSFGTKELSPLSFDIGNKKLFLVTQPQIGRYFLELEGEQNAAYTVGAAATLNNRYLEPEIVNGMMEAKNAQRLRLMLKQDGIELKSIKPFPLLLLIIPAVVGLVGGLLAAYLSTGGRLGGLQKAFAGIKWPKGKLPKIERIPEGKARKRGRVEKGRTKTRGKANKGAEAKADERKQP